MEKTYQERKLEKYNDFKLIIGEMSHVQLHNFIVIFASTLRPDEIEALIYDAKYYSE